MGWDPSFLHLKHIASKMSPNDRKTAGVKTVKESVVDALAKSEKQLQNQLYSLLFRRGHKPRMQRMDRKSNIAIGMPDIQFSYYGQSVEWEVKMPGKNPDDIQAKTHRELEAEPNCAIVRVIRSYREGMAHLDELANARREPRKQLECGKEGA